MPKLRARWTSPAADGAAALGQGLPPAAARGVLRASVTGAAKQARDEAGFFARLRADGVLVRLRFSELNPGEVTGYSVALPGHLGRDGEPVWYGGGKLAAGLSLPRLRLRWTPERPGRSARAEHSGAAWFTVAERNAIFEHAARYAVAATEHIRWCVVHDPARAADAAHAAAGTLHVAATLTRSKALRSAAGCYDRAARVGYGRLPAPTAEGRQLRTAARLLALTGAGSDDSAAQLAVLVARLVALVAAVAELREAHRHAAQAAAARAGAMRLREHCARAGPATTWHAKAQAARLAGPGPGHEDAPAAPVVNAGQVAGRGMPRSRPPPQPGRPSRQTRR